MNILMDGNKNIRWSKGTDNFAALSETAVGGEASISALAQGNVVHLAWLDASNVLKYKRYNGTAWGGTETIVTAGDANAFPQIALDEAGDSLYVVWGDSGDDCIYYRKRDSTEASGAWDSSDTLLVNESAAELQSTTKFGTVVSVPEFFNNSELPVLYMTGTASPWTLKATSITLNADPTITSASITSRDDSDNVYATKYYSWVAVVNDADGATDIDEVSLRAKDGAATVWEVKATSLTGTPSWSIVSGSTIIDLDSGASTWSEEGNQGTATFRVAIEWDHTQYDDLEIAVSVKDSAAATAGWTDKQTDYVDVITRLVTSNFAVSDTRHNVGGTVTFSGNVYFATTTSGNTASTVYPANARFTGIDIHDGSHTLKASDSSVVNGAFSTTSAILPGSATSTTYHVFLNLVPDYTDADAPDGDTLVVISDRVHATATSVSDTRDNVGDTVTVDWTLRYDYDEALVTDGSVTIEGVSASHQGSGVWRISPSQGSVTAVMYNEFTATGNGYGITAVDANGQTDTVIWDRIEIVSVAFSDSRINVGGSSEVRYVLRYDYDDVEFNSTYGSISGYAWDAGNSWWDKTVTASGSVGADLYDENDFAVTDTQYGLTAEEDVAGASLIADRIHANATSVSDPRDNVGDTVTVDWTLTYDYDESAVTDGSVTIEGVSASHQGLGVWRISPSKASVQAVVYDEFTAMGNTHGITAVDANGQSDTVIWDALKCTSFSRDVANQKLYVRMLYAYDSAAAENGSVAFADVSGTANSTGWAEIDLSGASSFDWGGEAYGTTDGSYGITATSQNQTITLAKYGKVIGGDAPPTTGTWDGTTLDLDFGLTTGTYSTEITATSAPSYVLNATYDTDTDLSGGVLTLSHDGSRDVQVIWESWGGLAVRGLTRGRLTSVSLASQALTVVVDGSTGSGTLYVDCTGRGGPTRSSGFDDAYWRPSISLWWGTYTLASNVTLVLEFSIGSGGSEGSIGGGGDTTVDIILSAITAVATQGQATEVKFPVQWTGPLTLLVESVGFGDYVDWFAIDEVMPLSIAGEGPLKDGELVFVVTPPSGTQPGNHTVPLEVRVSVQGFASINSHSYIYLTVKKAAGPQPAEGPITEAVGYILGIGLVAAIGLTLWKRD